MNKGSVFQRKIYKAQRVATVRINHKIKDKSESDNLRVKKQTKVRFHLSRERVAKLDPSA